MPMLTGLLQKMQLMRFEGYLFIYVLRRELMPAELVFNKRHQRSTTS